MKIVVDGRRIGNGYEASYDYDTYTAHFRKKIIHKSNVLHEFYHHLALAMDWNISEKKEEREADHYARQVLGADIKGS